MAAHRIRQQQRRRRPSARQLIAQRRSAPRHQAGGDSFRGVWSISGTRWGSGAISAAAIVTTVGRGRIGDCRQRHDGVASQLEEG
jgi:hypothetical protein